MPGTDYLLPHNKPLQTYGLKQPFIIISHSFVDWLVSAWGLSCKWSQMEAEVVFSLKV